MELENMVLFLAYICVADGYIHDKEEKFIEEYIRQNDLDESVIKEVDLIFKDDESKIPLKEVLKRFRNGKEEDLERAVILGLEIAYVDGYFENTEEDIFGHLLKETNFGSDKYLQLKKHIAMNLKKPEVMLKDNFTDVALKNTLFFLKNITSGKLKENIEKRYNKCLLDGKEYVNAIMAAKEIAKEDLKYVSSKLDDIDRSLSSAIHNLDNYIKGKKHLEDSEEESENELFRIMKDLNIGLYDSIMRGIEQNKATLVKKERSVNNYTITFMGKTKAGKSTLHSIITKEGKKHIGKGMQRTTRYNRIYEWKNIRIIDTPGIGAPGGQKDEHIAEQVIQESDLICYVLKADSIQESEFNFLKKVKDYNKPIIILLNYKENLRSDILFKRFLKDPENWFSQTGNKKLEGHLNRIREYASKHYKNGFFEIYPVQLLAAEMSQEDEYNDYANILFKASHMQDFLDAIRMQIVDEGQIKKSQTMLDGTIYTLNHSLQLIDSLQKPLGELRSKIVTNSKTISEKINESYLLHKELLEEEVENFFDELKTNDARRFANNNYSLNKREIGREWERFLEDNKVNKRLENSTKEIIDRYVDDVKDLLENVQEDFSLFWVCI